MATSSRGQTRQPTNATSHIIEGGNSRANAEQMRNFIKNNLRSKSQFIGITSNETDIEEGDNVITLFYRTDPICAASLPPDDIQFDFGNNTAQWEAQMNNANGFSKDGRSVEVLSVSCSPKNIGNMRCQTVWHTAKDGHAGLTVHGISRSDGDWQ